jgi:hypothetical protein
MPPNDPTAREVYDAILMRLREVGANTLADDIEMTVARGVVLTGQETEISQSSSIYRSMEDQEALAVALEFFSTSLDVPLMQAECRSILGSEDIQWRNERPGSRREDETINNAATWVDLQQLRPLLEQLVQLANQLEINLPEIA